MERPRILEVALNVLAAILLLVAAGSRYPYGIYMLLRTATTVCAAYWAVRVYQAGPRGWLWAFLGVALLMNPIFLVRMHRDDWQPIDLGLGVLLLCWSGYWGLRWQRRT